MFKIVQKIGKISLLALGLPILSYAQGSVRENGTGGRFGNYTVFPVFTPAPPVIDGLLNDFCWRGANILGVANPNAFNTSTQSFPLSLLKQNNINDNGTTGTPVAPPPVSVYAGRSASFSLVWDESYLYYAVKVVAPDIAAATTPHAGENIELFFNNGNGTSTLTPGETNWPRKYDAAKDNQVSLSYSPTAANTTRFLTKGSGFTVEGGFDVTDYLAATLKTSDGYVMEGKISWSDINIEFINLLTGQLADETKKPSKDRVPFRFDITNSIGKVGGTGKIGQLTWNQCCWNSNWTASQDFGTMKLIGVPGVVSVDGLTLTVPGTDLNQITAPAADLVLNAIVSPESANQNVTWSVINNVVASGEPIVKISPTGLISPLNNGIVTVSATTVATPRTTAFIVITVTGQITPTLLTMTGTNIDANWGSSTVKATVLPANTPQEVRYSLNEESKAYATVNSITGVVASKASSEVFTVTVIGTSVANKTVIGTFMVDISKQTPVKCFTINSYLNINQCRTLNTFNLGNNGVSFGSKFRVSLLMQYNDKYNTTAPGIIPSELVSITGRSLPTGTNVKRTANGDYDLEINGNSYFVTLTGYYLYSPTPIVVIGRILNTFSTTCDGTGSITGFDVRIACSTLASDINSPSSEVSKVSIYPNPASDFVTVSADGLASVTVYNLVGAKVATVAASSNEVNVNTSGFTSGIYIVTTTFKNGRTSSQKLAIE